MKPEAIARICHEANRALTAIIGDVPVQKPWTDIDSEMRHSCIKGVLFAIDHPLATPEDLHTQWCADKLKGGWRWGPQRDDVKLLHPSLVPYSDLSAAVKQKDDLFRAIVAVFR